LAGAVEWRLLWTLDSVKPPHTHRERESKTTNKRESVWILHRMRTESNAECTTHQNAAPTKRMDSLTRKQRPRSTQPPSHELTVWVWTLTSRSHQASTPAQTSSALRTRFAQTLCEMFHPTRAFLTGQQLPLQVSLRLDVHLNTLYTRRNSRIKPFLRLGVARASSQRLAALMEPPRMKAG
jgi:hypothetical protein